MSSADFFKACLSFCEENRPVPIGKNKALREYAYSFVLKREPKTILASSQTCLEIFLTVILKKKLWKAILIKKYLKPLNRPCIYLDQNWPKIGCSIGYSYRGPKVFKINFYEPRHSQYSMRIYDVIIQLNKA